MTIYLNLAQIVAKIWLPAAIDYRRGGGGVADGPSLAAFAGVPHPSAYVAEGWDSTRSHLSWDLVRFQSLIRRLCQGSRTAVKVGVPVVCRRNAVRDRGQCRGCELCHASA